MATRYPISKAEFKRRVRLVYESWPKNILQRNDHDVFGHDNPGCIMQVSLETMGADDVDMNNLVRGVSGLTLSRIAILHDNRRYAKALAEVEAL